jgi:TetR/AcrR family transcriptional repressor of nem operon
MRVKEFNEEEALARAVRIFWTRGFEGTSMSDLEEGMGIKRQSLYNTFRNKQTLYERALTHYHQTVIIPSFAPLQTSASPLKAIEAYFRDRIDAVFDPSAIKGCFITNSVTERGLLDDRARALAVRSLDYMRAAFGVAVAKAQELNEIGKDKDPIAWAALLLNCAQGLFVMSKTHPDRKTLTSPVKEVLNLLKS